MASSKDYMQLLQFMSSPNNSGLGACGVCGKCALDLGCTNTVAADINDVIHPAGDPDKAVIVPSSTITSKVVTLRKVQQ